jgi:hypothetical protein
MKHKLNLLIMFVLLGFLLGNSIVPASANTKETFTTEYYWYNPDAGICSNGQHVVEDSIGIVVTTIHRDHDGNLFIQEEDVTMIGGFYLLDQPWKRLDYDNTHWKNFIKPSGLSPSSGVVVKVTVPGYGILVKDIGHIVFEMDPELGYYVPIKFAGQHDLVPDWNFSFMCDYLTALP